MRPALVVAALSLLTPLLAGAATLGGLGETGSSGAFSLSVSPEYPAPHSQVVVSPGSSNLPLAEALMTVSVNGTQTYSGIARAFTVSLGGAGGATHVQAVLSINGRTYSQTLILVPQDVVLIVEPLSSAPPLYLGKPSVPLDGSVRLVALANLKDTNGLGVNSATNSYVWTVDGVQAISSSGIGRSSIIVPAPLLYRAGTVSVVVKNVSTGVSGSDSLSLTAAEPLMRIYENDPLLGIRFDRALGRSYAINSAEATLYAAPFSLPLTGGAPRVAWGLNGAPVQTGVSVTLRPAGSGKGTAALSASASSGQISSVTADLSLIFGSIKSSGFLGL